MRIVWLLFINILFVWADDELDILFKNITEFERKGIALREVQATQDPFDYRQRSIGSHHKGVARSGRVRVMAILNNEVKLGTRWVKLGGMYEGWKVVLIEQRGVHMENASGERRYYAISESKDIKAIR